MKGCFSPFAAHRRIGGLGKKSKCIEGERYSSVKKTQTKRGKRIYERKKEGKKIKSVILFVREKKRKKKPNMHLSPPYLRYRDYFSRSRDFNVFPSSNSEPSSMYRDYFSWSRELHPILPISSGKCSMYRDLSLGSRNLMSPWPISRTLWPMYQDSFALVSRHVPNF
ncbi:Uncharacterized protein TCM_029343 [Theobroma cacao]|uniref:Uncharacterized protein n=1 Tax=Theobroma cacao TaxID=3641 RepID=A0A061GD51_THECC|nr:Uncharacterized protein TCM_029343 [Theobroma cacao]